MRMIFLFIDGFGLGEQDVTRNPVYAAKAPTLKRISEEARGRFFCFSSLQQEAEEPSPCFPCLRMPTDALLGVPGLPQSATGQTAIFTGINAAAVLGRHLNAQPSITLKKIINNNNLFKMLLEMGLKITNANVYRQEYLDKMNDPAEKRYKPSVTSVMTMSAGLPFRMVQDYIEGKGVYHDITGQIIKDSGYDTQVITPFEAAKRLYAISREHDFTLFEHFMTDIIGHKMDMELAIKGIELLDAFVGELIRIADLNEDIIFITSDHGNIEDISVKTHTMNAVPTVILGKVPEGADTRVSSLLDIMPVVLDIFKKGATKQAIKGAIDG